MYSSQFKYFIYNIPVYLSFTYDQNIIVTDKCDEKVENMTTQICIKNFTKIRCSTYKNEIMKMYKQRHQLKKTRISASKNTLTFN